MGGKRTYHTSRVRSLGVNGECCGTCKCARRLFLMTACLSPARQHDHYSRPLECSLPPPPSRQCPRTCASASSSLVFCHHHHFHARPRLTSDPYLQRPLTTSPHPRSNPPASLVLSFFQLCRTLTPQHLPFRSFHLLSPTSHPRLPRQTPPPHASLIPSPQQPLPPRPQQQWQPS